MFKVYALYIKNKIVGFSEDQKILQLYVRQRNIKKDMIIQKYILNGKSYINLYRRFGNKCIYLYEERFAIFEGEEEYIESYVEETLYDFDDIIITIKNNHKINNMNKRILISKIEEIKLKRKLEIIHEILNEDILEGVDDFSHYLKTLHELDDQYKMAIIKN